MDFMNLEIPEEVIGKHILPKLNWNDLLRLRRVCKISMVIIDSYLRINPQLAPELEINDGDQSFGHFLKIGIPSTRIFINNASGHGFFEKDKKNQTKFLRQFGPLVKHLRVTQYPMHLFGTERDFLEALVNMETFEAGYFGIGLDLNLPVSFAAFDSAKKRMEHLAGQDRRPRNNHPRTFATVKVIKIGYRKELNVHFGNMMALSSSALNQCTPLEYALLPFNSRTYSNVPILNMMAQSVGRDMVLCFTIHSLNQYVEDRFQSGAGGFKVYDFANYHEEEDIDGEASAPFLGLCVTCKDPKVDVKLMNVGASWFRDINKMGPFSRFNVTSPVVSMVNMHPSVVPLPMPNLEKIDIRSTGRSCVGPRWREERQDWSALKSLVLTVDSKEVKFSEGDQAIFKQNTTVLFQFFFQGILRPAMTELSITFADEVGSKTVPKAEGILASCPNLRKLTLRKWPGTNKALIKLWSGLPNLEEISLDSCKDLGNVAFVGVDERSPVFFKLKKLRKLSLKGLDQMPKITDTLFSLVLRHMKLTHLILTSDSPVKSVTSAGVLKLLEGGFAESIEKFPFSRWSMDKVSAEEFRMMEMKFRSYNML